MILSVSTDREMICRDIHLVLVLNQKLDSLNGGSGSLGNGGRDTSHEEVGHEGTEVLGLGWVGHDAGSQFRIPIQIRVERNFKPSNSESGGRDKQEIPARCCYYPELVADS